MRDPGRTRARGVAALVLAAAAAGLAPPPGLLTVASPRGERQVPVRGPRSAPVVSADALAAVLDLVVGTTRDGSALVRVAGREFAFVLDAGYFRFDGRVYLTAAGAFVARDSLFVPLQWAVEHLPRLMPERFRYDPRQARLEQRDIATAAAPQPPPPPRRRVVALDAGHGGPDPGMSGPAGERRFLREKDVTLAIARYLREDLERRGHPVVMTRTTDTLIARDERGRLAARRGADIFVSLHVNAANPGWRNAAGARGFETYFLAEARTEDERRVAEMENAVVRFETAADAPRGDPLAFILNDLARNEHLRESSRLAQLVQGALGRVHPSVNRGVKQAPFAVLATSYMPAILIETGFGSNAAEARYLTSESGQRRLASAIADGVDRYLGEYQRRVAAGQR